MNRRTIIGILAGLVIGCATIDPIVPETCLDCEKDRCMYVIADKEKYLSMTDMGPIPEDTGAYIFERDRLLSRLSKQDIILKNGEDSCFTHLESDTIIKRVYREDLK